MKADLRSIFRGALAVVGCVIFLQLPQGVEAKPMGNEAAPDFSKIERQVGEWVQRGLYPGAGLIIGQGDRVLEERYFGSYRPETQVHVASAGKWLVAATIAAVVDSGSLGWDDPASRWLPELKGSMGRATLRQLLSHTAGYPDYQPAARERDHYQTLAEAVAAIVPLEMESEPGTHFLYGGLAMQVAGRMAEVATGKDWETLFQEKIARPLGMRGSGFTPVPEEEGFSPMLGGSAHVTLRDYSRFLQMIAAGGTFAGRKVLSKAAVEEMQRDQVGNARIDTPQYVELARGFTHRGIYGLGEWREQLDGAGRATLISSPGWAGAYPWIDKRTGTWGFLLAKVDVGRAGELGFSSFYSSPALAEMTRAALADAARTGVRHGLANVPGGHLYWEESGEGPPLILLHGHSFDRTMWNPQMAALTRHFRVIRYDMRGYGRSSMPQEGRDFLHADDLLALMNALGIDKAHLVGLSLGGTVAMDMLMLHPDRLLSVTAASGDIFDFYPGPDEPWTTEAIAKRRQEMAALRVGGIDAFKHRWLDQLTSRGGGCVAAIRPQLWRMIAQWSAWQPLHAEPRMLLGRSIIDRLRRSPPTVPLQILTGDADAGQPNPLLAVLPATPRVIVPNAGHVMNLENPDAFNRAVTTFALTSRPVSSDLLASTVTPCARIAAEP